jgi:hypothetical protein
MPTYNKEGVVIKGNASDGASVESATVSGIRVDNIPPNQIDFKNTTIGENSVLILWNTTENIDGSGSNSTVRFGIVSATLENTSYDITHSTVHNLNLSDLLEGTTYYWNATACDRAGNCNTSVDGPFSFATLDIAPIITNVDSSRINDTSALINWTTHESSNSSVKYGTTIISMPSQVINSTNTTSNRWLNITGLSNGVTYFFNVTSCDFAGNCNQTGPHNFTTLVDAAAPIVTNVLLNGSTTRSYQQNEIMNITAVVSDTSDIDSVWAYIEKQDGTTSNVTMGLMSGSTYTVHTTISDGGDYNVSVFAADNYSNTGNSSKRNFTAFGTFTIAPAISSPFRNYTFGVTNRFNITLYNEDTVTRSYNLSVTLSNSSSCSGWDATLNQTNITNLGSFSNANFELITVTPMCVVDYVTVNIKVNASDSARTNKTKDIEFRIPTVTVNLPPFIEVENVTYFLNDTKKYIKVYPINFSENLDNINTNSTRITCGIYNNASDPNSVVTAGTWNFTNSSCLIDATSTVSKGYHFIALANDTRNHSGFSSIILSVPGSINISLNQPNATSGGPFRVKGSAVYNSGYGVYFGVVNSTYENSSCIGYINGGNFDFYCNAPNNDGDYNLTVYITGIWNINSSATTTLQVGPPIIIATTENLTLSFSSDSIKIEKGSNTTFGVNIKNNLVTSKTFYINIIETGDTNKLQFLSYNTSITVAGNKTKNMNVVVTAGKLVKTGTSTIKVEILNESVSGTITANVTSKLINDEINIDRYVTNTSSTTTFGMLITNTKKLVVIFNLTENIPKTIATTLSDLVFTVQPNVTIDDDPIVMWQLTLKPGESTTIEYSVTKVVASPVLTAPVVVLIDFFLPGGIQQPGEVVQVISVTEDIRPLLIFIIFLITAVVAGIILFRGEWLGFKERPSLSFLKKKELPKIELSGFKSEIEKSADKAAKDVEKPGKVEKAFKFDES